MMRKISLVVPVHNEEAAIPLFIARVTDVLTRTPYEFELVFVDDGSSDGTVDVLLLASAMEPSVRVVELTRNFGKEAAMSAGFAYATGDAVIPMDVDLQDPPELLPEMLALWEEGHPVVLAVRENRVSDSLAKRVTAKAFYKIMSAISHVHIPENAGDFRLMDRNVVNALNSFPERSRFMKGLMAAVGFKPAVVRCTRPERSAGESKFNFWRLWNFAIDGITSFSTMPLRIWTYIGFLVAAISFGYASLIIYKTLVYGVVTPGYATTLTIVLLLGGLQMIGLGVLGEYLGRVVVETKRRPLFLVSELHGFEGRTGPTVVPYSTLARAA